MRKGWVHRWRYDENGQVFVEIDNRWWSLRRPKGTKMQLLFVDDKSSDQVTNYFSWVPPSDWPQQEVCCSDSVHRVE